MSAPIRKTLHFVKLIVFVGILYVLENVIFADSQDLHDFFLCRRCGREITKASSIINVPSKVSLRQRNDTFGPKPNVLIQLFKNPQGVTYEVVTATDANVYRASEETGGDTWWPGFNWIILACPQCKQHIGWEYRPQDKDSNQQTFFGLVLGNLLYDNDADSLIVLPKSYNS